MPIDNIPSRLLAQAKANGDKPAYYAKRDGSWQPTSWARYGDLVQRAAKSLIALGFTHGQTTCILGFNRPEWVVFDVATMLAGGAPAGIYTTCSPEEVQYIVSHSEARIVLLEDRGQWEKVHQQLANLPLLEAVVMMRGAGAIDHELVMDWDDFLSRGSEVEDAALDARLDALTEDQVATFIYTSGTTGPPKAVMLSHKNLTWTATKALELADLSSGDCSVSYLPLSHIAEQMFSIHAPITAGYPIWFAESMEKLAENLAEVQPTVVFGVPRVWEKMHAKVSARLAEATGVKRRVVDFATAVGREVTARRNANQRIDAWLGFKHKIADRLLFSKVKPLMGLGNAHMCVTGAAPISQDVIEFFASLDLTIHEVYGQSEDCGPTSFNVKGQTRYGTVGKPLSGTEVKIAEDGEITVRGPHVFQGYYKDEAATAATLVDGWLLTGDLGELDPDGYLKITGRKKEIIITAGGKNIAPKNIESALRDLPLVAQAVVIGDRRKFLSALLTLDVEAAEAFATERGLPTTALHELPAIRDEIQKGVESHVNAQFARVEHIRKFALLHRDFSVDEGELTPTLKIKRKPVNENFAAEIEAMYAD